MRDTHHRIPTVLMIAAPIPPAINGPTIGTKAYPQSEFPLSLIGRIACASRGPKSRAGFIAYPVGPPRLRPIDQTRTPHSHGPNPAGRPVGDTALLPKLKPTTIKQVVAMISVSKFAGRLRIAGPVQKMPNFAPVSGVTRQWGR